MCEYIPQKVLSIEGIDLFVTDCDSSFGAFDHYNQPPSLYKPPPYASSCVTNLPVFPPLNNNVHVFGTSSNFVGTTVSVSGPI